MPMLTDLQLLDGALAHKNKRVHLLVFVTAESNSRELWKAVNDFNYVPGTKRRVNSFYPILPAPDDASVEAVWQRYNPSRIAPLCVFLGEGGRETGIVLAGVPTTKELLKQLEILEQSEARRR